MVRVKSIFTNIHFKVELLSTWRRGVRQRKRDAQRNQDSWRHWLKTASYLVGYYMWQDNSLCS